MGAWKTQVLSREGSEAPEAVGESSEYAYSTCPFSGLFAPHHAKVTSPRA